jgi:tRNA1Val (adenine37-N6)-methyltransferase
MKIGTDGVTLGAYSSRNDFKLALDLGTGCGIIALMLAQKSGGKIIAIDVDLPSIEQTKSNFAKSKWSNRLSARNISAQQLLTEVGGVFDRIVSNPPFFTNSLKSLNERKMSARHNINLSLQELPAIVEGLLSPDGVFDIILPVDIAINFESKMYYAGLFIKEELVLYSVKEKPIRKIMSFSRHYNSNYNSGNLIIRKNTNHHTQEYINYTADFFLDLK